MRGLFSSICLQFLLTGLFLESQIFGQPANDFTLINERVSFGPAVLDDSCVYCYWPKSSVTEPTMTAIELATGQLRWKHPAKLAHPVNFRVEEGWLQFETTEGDPGSFRRSSGPKTFHLVNAASGEEINIPDATNLRSSVDRTWVYQNRCLTSKGQLIDCQGGRIIGELGFGEHQTITGNGSFLVMTLFPDESNTHFERRLLRKFDLETMALELEMELPLEESWRIIGVQGDLVVGRIELPDRSSFLSCLDLASRNQRWRVPVPKSVFASNCQWEGTSLLILSAGVHGLVRPLRVDMESGAMSPDQSWFDPRLLLAWHQEAGQYADFVASNDRFLIGRWRYLQLSCVNAKTGELFWNQGTGDYLIGRVFAANAGLTDYVVAETKTGIDIINVATGHRNSITPEQVGLNVLPLENYLEVEKESQTDATNALFGDSSIDWLLDKGLLLGSLIPFAGWLFWSLIRR